MPDRSNEDNSVERQNPYETGEAAIDPSVRSEPQSGGRLQISPTDPPGEPNVCFYLVPATDLDASTSIGKSFQLVREHFLYLTVAALLMVASGFVVWVAAGVLTVTSTVGWGLGIGLRIALYYLSWVASVTIFATIEEANGSFEGSASPGGGGRPDR